MNPTSQQIHDWKQIYGPIYQIDEFIVRGITLAEHDLVLKSEDMSSAEKEEAIVKASMLWPEDADFDLLPAGLITQIAQEVISYSGFGDPKKAIELLNQFREASDGNVFALMKAMILATMPIYSEEDLDSLTFSKLLNKVVLAEGIISVQQSAMTGADVRLQLVDPDEEEEKKKRSSTHHNVNRKPGQSVYGDPIAEKLRQALG